MPGRANLPSAAVATSTKAAPSPTSRSAWTTAPGTAPSGPATDPLMVALPGDRGIVVVVRPGTSRRATPVRSGTAVVDARGLVVGGAGSGSTPLGLHAATRQARATTTPAPTPRFWPRKPVLLYGFARPERGGEVAVL